tara:strand:- start:1123 stop:1296 length:174 start_codon:yes stop_codon:yes gene_type:complete
MVEIALQTKLVIGIITIVVFYFLTRKTIKNISFFNDDGDKVINLDKLRKRNREKNGD